MSDNQLEHGGMVSGAQGAGMIRTISGRLINIVKYEEKDVCLEDFARALSNQCRFAGHMDFHVSIAFHSMLVRNEVLARVTGKMDDAMCHKYGMVALLHDTPETYNADFPAPHKPRFLVDCGEEIISVRKLEKQIMQVILRRFDLEEFLPEMSGKGIIKLADKAVCRDEIMYAIRGRRVPTIEEMGCRVDDTPIVHHEPQEMERAFLEMFRDHRKKLHFLQPAKTSDPQQVDNAQLSNA